MEYFRILMEEANGEGNDLPGIQHEETLDDKAKEIINQMQGEEPQELNEDIKLPSDEEDEINVPEEQEEVLFAGKYKSVDALKDGIKNIGSDLPDYIIDGMNDEALEKHYNELNKNFSSSDNKSRKFSEKKEEVIEEDNADKKPVETKELWTELEDYFKNNSSISDDIYNKFE